MNGLHIDCQPGFYPVRKNKEIWLDERLPLDLLKIKNQPGSYDFSLRYFPVFIPYWDKGFGFMEPEGKKMGGGKERDI